MQGEISLRSQPGQGTEVVLRLPLLDATGPAALAPALPPPPEQVGTVLLVDDDALSRVLLAEMLRACGHQVIEAADASEGLALWRSQGAATVISDRHMPGGDGPELLRRIAEEAQAAGCRPPWRILCTGDPGAPGEAAALGVDLVIEKPVTLAVLQQALRSGAAQAAGLATH
jgi:CheY-like chemotaxis protein